MQIHYFKTTLLYSHEVSFWSDNRHNQLGFSDSVTGNYDTKHITASHQQIQVFLDFSCIPA